MLEQALKSIKTMYPAYFQIVICDDSTKEYDLVRNKAIVESYRKTIGSCEVIYIVNKEHSGVARTRNIAVRNALGEWILFLDDDDQFTFWYPDYVLNLISQPGFPVSVGWSDIFEKHWIENGQFVTRRTFSPMTQWEVKRDFLGVGAGYGLFIKKETFLNVGGYDERMRVSEDTDLFFRLLHADIKITHIPVFGMIVSYHPFNKLTNGFVYQAKNKIFEVLFWKYLPDLVANNLARYYRSWVKRIYIQNHCYLSYALFCLSSFFAILGK